MAYRAVSRDDAQADEPSTLEAQPFLLRRIEPVEFTPLEEQVITLARMDRLGSLEAPGRIERFFSLIFGLNPRMRALADPRLEALRRAVVVANHRHHLPDVQAAELREVGFTPDQVQAIEHRAIAA